MLPFTVAGAIRLKAEILPIAVYLALSGGIGMLAALIIISAVLAEISLFLYII